MEGEHQRHTGNFSLNQQEIIQPAEWCRLLDASKHMTYFVTIAKKFIDIIIFI